MEITKVKGGRGQLKISNLGHIGIDENTGKGNRPTTARWLISTNGGTRRRLSRKKRRKSLKVVKILVPGIN